MNPALRLNGERPFVDRVDHGREFVGKFALSHPGERGILAGSRAAQCSVMATVVADLVENGPGHQVAHQRCLRRIDLLILRVPVPGLPVTALGVANEEQNLLRLLELEGQHEAGVVDTLVQNEGELLRGEEPVLVDAPPGGVARALLLKRGRSLRKIVSSVVTAEKVVVFGMVEGFLERYRKTPAEGLKIVRGRIVTIGGCGSVPPLARLSRAITAPRKEPRAATPWPGNASDPCGFSSPSRSASCGGPRA